MLYNGVTGVIVEHMNAVAAKVSATHDANLLLTVCSEWERQKTFLRSIDDVLMYLVRAMPRRAARAGLGRRPRG